MSFRNNDIVFTILLLGAVFIPLDLYDGVNCSSGWIFCSPTINCTQLWVSELTTSVFTILLMGAVFYPWIFMMVLMVQAVEYFSSTYLLAPVGWPTIMSLQNNDSVFTIMEIVALSLIIFALSLSLSFRSLIFNFIDNVKPQPDPKGKISKFEFRVLRIVDGTGFVFSKITIIIFRRHQGPLTETSLKTRSIQS